MTIFKRKYEIAIGVPGKDGFLVSELDINFTVTKGQESEKSQNKLALKIFNLSKEHRNSLVSKENMAIIFKAGYSDQINTIFQGKITKSYSEKNGVDFETNIDAGDGYIALRESKSSQSFKPKCNALDVVTGLLKDLISNDKDLSIGTIFNDDILSKKIFETGYSCIGYTKAEINKLLSPLKMNFSIQNEIIYISSINNKTNQEVLFLTKDSGLINSPQKVKNDPQATEKETTPKDSITFECLLNGTLNPLSMIKIQSEEINGVYKIINTEHRGEFMGDNWQTKCIAVEVKQ